MVTFVILHISFEFGAQVFKYTAIMIAKGQLLESMELLQRQEWVYLFVRTAKYGSVGLAIVFWGMIGSKQIASHNSLIIHRNS